jgi:energy-coupling factor transporter ATP-binding protein EcfA2
VLELKNVSFAYPDGPQVIRDVSLVVGRGARLAIMGENGSGKTTLANLMCGLLEPAAGEVRVEGHSTGVSDSIYEVRRRVGIVFQDPDDQLIETTVEREIGFGPRNLGLSPAEVRTRVDRALGVFGISHLRGRSCHLLSAGEKQKVTVASVFVMQPDYIILDESTALLDAESRRGLVAAVEQLLTETGAGLIFVSMRLEDVWMCDRVVFVKNGSIGFEGAKPDLLRWLGGQGLPLVGLPLLLGRLDGAMPGFAEEVASVRRLSGESIGRMLAGSASDGEGGAACR